MAKSNNQKAKILFLEQMLRETGENRTVSMQEILDKLAEQGIAAERKSVYDDMEALRIFGMDVRFRRGRPGGYYLAENTPTEREEERQHTEAVKETEEFKVRVDSFVHGNASGDKKMKLLCDMEREAEVRAFFGDAAEYTLREDNKILVATPVLLDSQFFGWLTAMGLSVRIQKPKKVIQTYRDYLKLLAREYKGM